VFGALAGHVARVLPVCSTWEDEAWAYCRAWLDLGGDEAVAREEDDAVASFADRMDQDTRGGGDAHVVRARRAAGRGGAGRGGAGRGGARWAAAGAWASRGGAVAWQSGRRPPTHLLTPTSLPPPLRADPRGRARVAAGGRRRVRLHARSQQRAAAGGPRGGARRRRRRRRQAAAVRRRDAVRRAPQQAMGPGRHEARAKLSVCGLFCPIPHHPNPNRNPTPPPDDKAGCAARATARWCRRRSTTSLRCCRRAATPRCAPRAAAKRAACSCTSWRSAGASWCLTWPAPRSWRTSSRSPARPRAARPASSRAPPASSRAARRTRASRCCGSRRTSRCCCARLGWCGTLRSWSCRRAPRGWTASTRRRSRRRRGCRRYARARLAFWTGGSLPAGARRAAAACG
jgi:hypothetical protein